MGVALALAVVGGMSLAAKRFNLTVPGFTTGSLRSPARLGVLGVVRIGPKQSVHLVRVGDRVLIVGTGATGGPTTLGEVTDPGELHRLISHRPGMSWPSSPSTGATNRPHGPLTRLDQRIGDDE